MTSQPTSRGLEPLDEPRRYRPGYLKAADRILDLIAAEHLNPGDRLPTEGELAEVLELSKSVVREAIKVLSAVGRISVEKGRGIYVADAPQEFWSDFLSQLQPTDPEQIYSLFEIRVALEELSVRLACERAGPTQVRTIADAADESAVAAEGGEVASFASADMRFHRSIAMATNNEYLVNMLSGVQKLHGRMSVVTLAGTAAGSLVAAAQQHKRISDAVNAGDATRASELIVEHIQLAQQQVQEAIRNRVFSEQT